ncbi:unnamed protein product [Durusdinium trenchii]|uniref:Uncharacterized protein n=1 Tax=Durusdinium trenchii TaxID=1381693 RepID=A0ABP0KBZ7_9DINO
MVFLSCSQPLRYVVMPKHSDRKCHVMKTLKHQALRLRMKQTSSLWVPSKHMFPVLWGKKLSVASEGCIFQPKLFSTCSFDDAILGSSLVSQCLDSQETFVATEH